jgi:rod shape-determining protein MreC
MRGRQLPGRTRSIGGLTLFALLFLSCALLAIGKLDLAAVRSLRWQVIELVTPALAMAQAPVTHARRMLRGAGSDGELREEIERLRADNQRLKAWEWRARELERKLQQLARLTQAGEESGLEFATGRVLSDSRGPFSRTVLLDIGRGRGVKPGHAAVTGEGFVGHVVDTGEAAARVLLLTDVSSRVPVLIGPQGQRAILNGDNTLEPRLTHLATDARLEEGDEVVTSGHDGMLPRGLKVGELRLGEEGPRVQLAVRFGELEYLSVLFFEPPRLDAPGQRVGEAAREGELREARRRREGFSLTAQ